MTAAEFSRPVDRRHIAAQPVTLEANEDQREALASRFGLVAVNRLEATITLEAALARNVTMQDGRGPEALAERLQAFDDHVAALDSKTLLAGGISL